MALSTQQVEAMRQQYGLSAPAGTGAPSTSVSGLNTNPRMNLIFGAPPKPAPVPTPGSSGFYDNSPEAAAARDTALKNSPAADVVRNAIIEPAKSAVEGFKEAAAGDVIPGAAKMAEAVTRPPVAAASTLMPKSFTDKINEISEQASEGDPIKSIAELMNKHPKISDTLTNLFQTGLNETAFAGGTKVPEAAADVGTKVAPVVGAATDAAGAATGSVVDMIKSAAKAPLNALRGYADSKVRDSIKNDVQSLLSTTGAISKRASEITQKGNDIGKTFSDPAVFNGLKVENGRINPDPAIEVLDNRIEPLVETLNKKVLPVLDNLGVKISLGDIWQRAKDYLNNSSTLEGDKTAAIQRMQDQLSHYVERAAANGHEGDSLPIGEIDKMRADARGSARDAKGTMKSDSEYAAIETAARDAVFDAMDKLSDADASDFKGIRNYIKQMIETRTFADKTLRGMSVEKGNVRGTAMRLLGTLAGGTHGPLGILAGHGMGGLIADIVTNTQLGSSFKMSLIRDLTDSPTMIQHAQNLLAQVEKMRPPLLGSGKGTPTPKPSGPTLYSGPGGLSENIEDAGGPSRPSNERIAAHQDIEDEIQAAHDYHSQYEPYTPDNKLPIIKFGKNAKKQGPRNAGDLPAIK